MTSEELREKVKHMNPIDDLFFKKMSEDSQFCLETIWAATGDHSIRLDEHVSQAVVANLQGRSVVLDVACIDSEGKRILVEVQRSDDDDHVKRVRYNTSVTTANITDPGTKFEKVPRILSIFITRDDFVAKLALKQGMSEEELEPRRRAVYHVDRVVRETGQILDNGVIEIYVNAKVYDGTEASDLMRIYVEDDAYDREKFPAVSERKWRFKNVEKEVNEMGYTIEDFRNEGRAEGRVEGYEKRDKDKIKEMLNRGKDPREISDFCNYPIDLVNQVQESMAAVAE